MKLLLFITVRKHYETIKTVSSPKNYVKIQFLAKKKEFTSNNRIRPDSLFRKIAIYTMQKK
jgi:hypothetical protein